jgi:alanine racemase
MSKPTNATWIEVDLGAIRNNIRLISEATKCAVMAVVKANGYGHGIVEVARTAEQAGAEWLGVARIDEALQIREAGVDTEILILGHTSAVDIPLAIQNNVTLAVHSFDQLEKYSQIVSNWPGKIKIHVKVDTGMGRLGVSLTEAYAFIQAILKQEKFQLEGIFTHMARADEIGVDTTRQQIARFNQLLDKLSAEKIEFKWIHAANSASAIFHPDSRFNLVRPGISIYGLNPSPSSRLPETFCPSLSWKTVLTSVKVLPPNYGVSYGHAYFTKTTERVGTISVGYGDGFRRVANNEVIVRGVKVPVLGNVCMDQCIVSLEAVPSAIPGDEVILIGSQLQNTLSAEDVAIRWNTIVYEPICGLTNRIPRVYLNRIGE